MPQELINKYYFYLFTFTLTFGVIFYDLIGFDYTDEFCALFLFILFLTHLFKTPNWEISKAFLITIGIFIFYLAYSLYIGSNSIAAILTDFVIQIKPYLAFFCVYSLTPYFNKERKKLLRDVAILFWVLLLIVALIDIFFVNKFIYIAMGHPAYFAAGVIMTALCYLYCSKFTFTDKIVFLVLLSLGLISGRSKFYGFFTFALIIIPLFQDIKQFRFNLKNTIITILVLIAITFAAQEKLYFYFYQAVTEEVNKDMIARYVLYANAPNILQDYFPFGSGFASYGTYASGLYYSDIYAEYGIDGVWGMTKNYYSFIADTYYPSLAQFGIAGIFLYLTFWIYILRKAFIYAHRTGNIHDFALVFLIAIFFAIEGTTDSTFTTHRGFFALMLLGLVLSNMRQKALNLTQSENEKNENIADQ